ncbi:apoptotic chromatin condensation inducer in the nucleus-like [Dendronephthya gigantea]|uniref:apoptotic chromatin condensation inducer in the nucleus-like n=1 Tax=Dendronephthya gigantea TaxID=151771 RepID=UPI00106A1451|nr:apoptotic chromatin condensation inducer in the nucleus-like [Dendronephthya gigantea]XP_028391658.1 apoptotic chromatin condensation inducer in the nucleus-like [Dendronephthya gigantea]XP_028391659.1 apoptotic chromatin condensation inducer in the nucleus-like [Dendronephthya gigantea]
MRCARILITNLTDKMASTSKDFASLGQFEINGKPVMKLKVDELKVALVERGLEKTGLKKELQERLLKALEEERNSAEANSLSEEKPTVSNDEETSIQEVSSTTGETREAIAKDESPVMDEKKEVTENTEEIKEEKKSAEADSTENKEIVVKKAEELEDGEIIGQDEEKKDNQKPVVAEKRRIISLTRQTSNPPAPGTRKRKWSSSKAKPSVVISTDSLKGLIPVVQLASTPALEAVMELDDDKDGEDEVKDETQGEEKEEKDEEVEITPNNKSDDKPPYKRRIVQVADSKMVKLGQTVNEEEKATDSSNILLTKEEPVVIVDDAPKGPGSHENSHSPATPSSSANGTPVKREVSPPRNPPSCAIHVSNLVRPFTQKQIMLYLSTFGAVTEEGFWMNKIKSHCYIIYGSVDEATNARQSMHGQRWPATSPRTLRVDFADNDKMLEDTDGALGKKAEESAEQTQEKTEEEGKERSRSKEKSSRKHKTKKEEKKKDEPSAANLLDKLFRKTTAVPCIYWLPLTNEQVVTRQRERNERRKQREIERQQEDDDDQKPREPMRNPPQDRPRGPERPKPRESPREQDRRPLRDNRGASPQARQRPERRPSPVKRRSRSRSPGFRRAPNRRR